MFVPASFTEAPPSLNSFKKAAPSFDAQTILSTSAFAFATLVYKSCTLSFSSPYCKITSVVLLVTNKE